MFREFIGVNKWRNFSLYTLEYNYQVLQDQIIQSYMPYRYMIERYSESSGRKVQILTEEDIHTLKIKSRNIALLKNAIQLWKDAFDTSESIAPVLFHYSVHCFTAFFIYSFFRWDPEHAKSHGIRISRWDENILDIQILNKGLFQRLVDTWILLGATPMFSPLLGVYEGEEIHYVENDNYLLKNDNRITLRNLLEMDFEKMVHQIISNQKNKITRVPSLNELLIGPNEDLRNYLILFTASSIARYRPLIWESILLGHTKEQSDFGIKTTGAIEMLLRSGLINNVSKIFQEIKNGRFSIMPRE